MRSVFESSLIILTEDQNWKLRILNNCIHIKIQSLLQTLNSCKFNLWGLFFFLGKNFWILNSMLTLSFIHNFAPEKIKPKTMDRKTKAFITLFISFQDPIFKQRSTTHRKPCVEIFSTKKLYTKEIMSVSTVSINEVTRSLCG